MKKFAYTSTVPDTLGSGRPVQAGDQVDLSADDEKDTHNARLIEEGVLAPVSAKSAPKTKNEESK